MSEQKTNYMATLDEWTDLNIIIPLFEAAQKYKNGDAASDTEMRRIDATVKKLVREKVLESYRNGQAAKGKERTWKI